jgi:hypothetical protein
MYYHEMNRCNVARTVYGIKTKNLDTENWAKWAEKNPSEAKLLANVERMIAEMEDA